jgi:hypothetical protein
MNYPNLKCLMNYKNNKILLRYDKDYPAAKMGSKEAFKELMKYIWLHYKHEAEKKISNNKALNFSCLIHEEMIDIDNMWHTFLLFTKDYHAFCNDYLDGIFLHHDPIGASEEKVLYDNYDQELSLYLSYIYDNLGEDTVLKWFNN